MPYQKALRAKVWTPELCADLQRCKAGELSIKDLTVLLAQLPLGYIGVVLETPARELLQLEDPVGWQVLENTVRQKQTLLGIIKIAQSFTGFSKKTDPP